MDHHDQHSGTPVKPVRSVDSDHLAGQFYEQEEPASGISTEDAEKVLLMTIENLSADKPVHLDSLKSICALINAPLLEIATFCDLEAHIPICSSIEVLAQCRNVHFLINVCGLLMKKISGSLGNADSTAYLWQYWYSEALNSSYLCLKYLDLRKAVHVETKHFHEILSCAINCVKNIQLKQILIPTYLFVHLFSIISACLSELSSHESLDIDHAKIALAAIPYFNHSSVEIQVAAMYTGHFLIPLVKDNSPNAVNQLFELSKNNLCSILQACGHSISTSCCLKVLLSFSVLLDNRILLINEGALLFCASTIILSSKAVERQYAFCLLRRLLGCENLVEDNIFTDPPIEEYQKLNPVFVATSLIPRLMSDSVSSEELVLVLKEIEEASSIPENRELFRKCGVLQCLNPLLETYSHSEVASTIASLICILLSDEQGLLDSSEQNTIQCMESELREEPKHAEPASTLRQQLVSVGGEDQSPSEIVKLHAQCVYGLLTLARDEFLVILRNNKQVVSIYSLTKAVHLLRNLCIMYEKEVGSATDKRLWEKQIVFASSSHFPKFFYISFRALESIYSDNVPDIDKLAYEKVLKELLAYLHSAIEQWSRMPNIRQNLIENGTFYLLINELHTHTTAHLLNEDILYTVLTSFYNVLLSPKYSQYFRVLVKHQLLEPFFRNPDLKYLAKFNYGCLHEILSKKELDSFEMGTEEVNLLSRCLKRESSFFGGYEQLVLVVSKLANFPKNWTTFVESGIIHILVLLATTESGQIKEYALRALLNIIPEPVVTDSANRRQQSTVQRSTEPLTNVATEVMMRSTTLVETVLAYSEQDEDICQELCHGIKILTSPLAQNEDLHNIAILEKLGRFCDCWRLCEHFLSSPQTDSFRNKVLFHKATSLYRVYNRELPAMLEKSEKVPGFKYKAILSTFCKEKILEVVRILTTLIKYNEQSSGDLESQSMADRLSKMLDKALLDSLVFKVPEIGTCLLCHTSVRRAKLTNSHYIPKSIILEFVKALGAKPGDPVFHFLSVGNYPSDWHRKSAGQITYSMLCQTCDGKILSKDENVFKKDFFDKVYTKADLKCLRSSHSVFYNQYLLRFAAGLLFRSVAPRYSQVSADIGNFEKLSHMMQMCRAIILENSTELPQDCIKIFLFALPSAMPMTVVTPGWDQFVKKVLSPYIGYKLFKPGSSVLPTKLFCCMVKIGALLFVTSLDSELERELLDFNPLSLIQSNAAKLYIPRDEIRIGCIPEKLWWSLAAWTKKELESALATTISLEKVEENQAGDEKSIKLFSAEDTSLPPLAPKHDNSQSVVVNLLPPGFSLNFDKYNTLPEKVIELPPDHVVLLHRPFLTSTGAEFFIVLAKQQKSITNTRAKKGTDYSWPNNPCVLVYLHQSGTENRSVLKVGFYIKELDCSELENLPGSSPELLKSHSAIIQDIIRDVPTFVRSMLRSSGFLSFKSLLFWSDSLRNVNDSRVRIRGTLDTRCRQESCNYCDMRCDCCMQPGLEFHQTKVIRHFKVQSCSKECSEFLFKIFKECKLKRIERSIDGLFVPRGHTELYRGCFSTITPGCPGMNSMVIFSLCQNTGEEAADDSYQLPRGIKIKYIKFWQRCLKAPNFLEYIVDDQCNASKCVPFVGSGLVHSNSPQYSETLMHQVHDILTKLEIPHRLASANQ